MNLLILPGGGNPETERYRKVYKVISSPAKQRYGYKDVYEHIRWPGQCSPETYDITPPETFTASIKVAMSVIDKLADLDYSILARSYGCAVALELACQKNWSNPPSRIMLWGPSPYWKLWRMFIRDIELNQAKAKEKGLKIDNTFFPTLKPAEALITEVDIPTVVATGAEDTEYCDLHFFKYLKSIVEADPVSKRYVKFAEPVQGAGHEVTEDSGALVVNSYLKALFE